MARPAAAPGAKSELEAPAAAELPITTSSPAAIEAFTRGRDLFENSRPQDAVPHLKRAVELDPGFAQAHAYLGKCLPGAEGDAYLAKAVLLAEALPEAERLWIEHSHTSHRGDLVTSREELGRLVALLPNDTRILFAVGYQALKEADWDEAAAAFRKASEHNPKPAVFNALGYSLARQGNLEDAIAAMNKYVAATPGEPDPHDALGEVQLMTGNLEEAEASFRRALALAPSFPQPWQGIAQIRFLRGEWAEGRKALARFRQSAGWPLERAAADAHLVISHLAEGQVRAALTALDAFEKSSRAEKWQPGMVLAADLRGMVLADTKHHADAIRQFSFALGHLGHRGVPERSRPSLRRDVLLHMAVSQSALNRPDEVEETLEHLEADAKRVPRDKRTQQAVHAVKGLQASARKDAAGAVAELRLASSDDPYVDWQLLLAQERAGDRAAAEQTRARILSMPRPEALYLFVRSRVSK